MCCVVLPAGLRERELAVSRIGSTLPSGRDDAAHYFIKPFGQRHVTSCRLRQYRRHYRSMILRRNQNIRIYWVYSRTNATHVPTLFSKGLSRPITEMLSMFEG